VKNTQNTAFNSTLFFQEALKYCHASTCW